MATMFLCRSNLCGWLGRTIVLGSLQCRVNQSWNFRAIFFLTCQPRWIRTRAGTRKHQIRSQRLGHEGRLWNKCQCLLSLFFFFFGHQRCIPGGAWMLPSLYLRQALTFFMSNLHERGPRARDPFTVWSTAGWCLRTKTPEISYWMKNYGPVENIEDVGQTPDEEKERCCPHQTLSLVEYLYMYKPLNLFPRHDICASACIYNTYLPHFSLFSFFSSQSLALELWISRNPCGLRIRHSLFPVVGLNVIPIFH